MNFTQSMKIDMKRILITFTLALLSGCATQYVQLSPEGRNSLFKEFQNGNVRQECRTSCSGSYGLIRDELLRIFKQKDWKHLAVRVATNGFYSNQAYFYLGISAENLRFSNAALKYYTLAQDTDSQGASLRCDYGLFNNCDGINVSKNVADGIERLRVLAQREKEDALELEAEKKRLIADIAHEKAQRALKVAAQKKKLAEEKTLHKRINQKNITNNKHTETFEIKGISTSQSIEKIRESSRKQRNPGNETKIYQYCQESNSERRDFFSFKGKFFDGFEARYFMTKRGPYGELIGEQTIGGSKLSSVSYDIYKDEIIRIDIQVNYGESRVFGKYFRKRYGKPSSHNLWKKGAEELSYETDVLGDLHIFIINKKRMAQIESFTQKECAIHKDDDIKSQMGDFDSGSNAKNIKSSPSPIHQYQSKNIKPSPTPIPHYQPSNNQKKHTPDTVAKEYGFEDAEEFKRWYDNQ